MGAEKWIICMVLASLGAGIYIMSYLVDENILEQYGEKVAEYNAQHHETMMDVVRHRSKRGQVDPSIVVNEDSPNKYPGEMKIAEKESWEEDKGKEFIDHPYSENDRIMKARIDEKPFNYEKPVLSRASSSRWQGINKEGSNYPYYKVDRGKRSSRWGIDEGDPEHLYPEVDRAKRSSGQGIDEGDPEHLYPEVDRAKRSSGQGIDEGDPEHLYPEVDRAKRSNGWGIDEGDPEHPYPEVDRAKRSSGQGIDEGDPEHLYPEVDRAKRSSGQGIDEGDPEHPYPEDRAKRSSGQGIDERDPEHPYPEVDRSRQGILEENYANFRPLWLSEQDINSIDIKSERVPHTHLFSYFHTPSLFTVDDLFESGEDFGGLEEEQNEPSVNLPDILDSSLSRDDLDTELWNRGSSSSEEDHAFYYQPYLYLAESSRMSRKLNMFNSDDDEKRLVTFNKGIDFILRLMNSLFSLAGETSVPLPQLNKTFGHGIMKGRFQASYGFFENPATLHRTGDVAIVKNGDSVGLEVALGLETLEAGYGHYDIKILKIHQNGTVAVSVAENSIKMKISLTYYPHCKVDVNYLELDELGGIKVEMTGLGAFQSMFDMLSKWLLDNFTDDFRRLVNKKLIEKAKKAVARQDICEYFPLSLL